MKIILKEYLASIKERGDLDKSVIPNLLSEIGLRVLNTPMIGTRQNGVDIAAVGKIKNKDNQQYLYLFCIKAGNISRNDWSSGPQAVRPELEEIKDVYIRSNIAREYQHLPIKICLCCGGELEETILTNWSGYTNNNTTDLISYEEWNGDRLADLMMQCLLARELLDEEPRRNFQKAVAMVNEPSACYDYTNAFLRNLLLGEFSSRKDQLLRLRQSFICLHAVIAWSDEAKNLEGAYKVSELGVMLCWGSVRKDVFKKKPTKHDRALTTLLDQFLKLYLSTSDKYLKKTVYSHGDDLHALSAAVTSAGPVDVNLAMFELLGRIAVRGIWTDHFSRLFSESDPDISKEFLDSTDSTIDKMISVINSNPTLCSPIKDDHMIEISLVMYLANLTNSAFRFLPWLHSITDRTTFALTTNFFYPTCIQEYGELIRHPKSADQSYLNEACAGSILYPYLYCWIQHTTNDKQHIEEFVNRLNLKIPNCNHQAWFPDETSDNLIWHGNTYHGVCISGLSPENGIEAVSEKLNSAIQACTAINEISAVKVGLTPLLLTALRHYRLPIPPNFWFAKSE